jgi:hypothetical protein
MSTVLDAPRLIVVISLVALWLASQVGAYIAKNVRMAADQMRDDLTLVLNATLALLGLIIGFTFSMAINRYDQRKIYEEEEANAIGTEYLRIDFLPPAEAERAKTLIRQYLDQRILYYEEQRQEQYAAIDVRTQQLEGDLWAIVLKEAAARPTPTVALATSGMNDIFNSEGYTRAAWRNRIPEAAWILIAAMSLFCCGLMGYMAHERRTRLFAMLAVILSISFFLLADIDSPRHGLVRLHPVNRMALASSLR